ncbi:hypothetical protein SRHO_G00009390 [Serrasalmus rhombeus]
MDRFTVSPHSTTPQLVSEVVLRDEMRRISEELERLRRETEKPSGATRKRQQLDGPSDSDLQRSARRATAAVTPPTPHAQAAGTATSTAASTTRRLSLPCYNGDADWAAFDAQLEVVASCEGWSDAETAAQLCLALQGPALRVLVELPAECRRELAPLKRALMTRFGRQPDESAAKLLLANRRRNRGERIGVLASEVALLVRQAYPSFPREAQQQLSLDHFVRALEPGELRMHVRLANPITIDAAVDEATRAETILSGKGDGWDATARPRVGPPDKKLTCWKCGEIGHKANTCKSSGNETGAARPDLLPDDVGEALALSGRRTELTTVTGNRFELVGCVSVTLDFGHGPWTQSFWVGGIMDACILGGDFLERVGAVFDFGSGSLILNGRRVAVYGGTEMVERPGNVAARRAGSDTTAPFSVDPVRDLWERSRAGLSEGQGQLLWALLDRFRGVFAVSERECSRTGLAVHAIDTGDALPVRLRPHRLPLAKRLAAEQQINEMAASGVIEPSSSSWSAPVVLAKKKDGSWRFCIDYRRLNAVTRADSYPVPRVDDTLERLAGSDWFSSLDLRNGYWQVPLADTAKEKTAFSIGTGLWQFTVLPFGLCNAPATFERLMERVLAGVAREKCVVYLDDVLVHAAGFEAALANLELVLGLIKKASLSLNPAKCNLLQRRVSFLGHVVSGEGIATDPNKTAAVRDWPTPRTVRQVRSFLGFASYYRRFVKGFAEIAAPLHRLTGGSGAKFRWSDEADRAFLALKEKLCSTPVLAYPIPSGQFVVDTDASDHGLGAVLSQMQDGSERVIAYFSRRLDKAERNYCVTRRELLAVVEGLRHFRTYVYGVPFKLRTDHASLLWLMRFREPEGQLARWLTRLQEFDYTAEHRPGRSHGNADALSRRPCTELSCVYCQRAESRTVEVGRCAAVGQAPFAPPTLSCVSGEELSAAQKGDPELEWALRGVETGLLPDWDVAVRLGPVAKAIRSSWGSMRIVRGILCRVWEDPSNGRTLTQAVVPRRLRDAVLQAVHGLPGSGHFGITKTLGRLRQRFWWPGCRADVELHVHCCDICAAKKGPAKAARAPLQPMQSGSPMERVAVDVLGPFPITDAGNRFIIVAMDYFTKWPEAYAVPDQSAVTTAEALVDNFFCRFGVPEVLHSDQGRNFESEVMGEVCRLMGVHKTRTTPLHPQCDGLVERFNRTLAAQLAIATQGHQRDWDKRLPVVLLACRSAVQETSGFTPAMLMFGRELRSPIELAFGAPPDSEDDTPPGPPFVRGLLDRLRDVHKRTRENQSAAGNRQRRAYDMRCYGASLPVDSNVWLYNPQRKKGLCPKLQSAWVGPCRVLSRIGEVVYRIRWGRRRLVVHRDRLAPYRPKLVGAGRRPDSPAPISPSVSPNTAPSVPPLARPQRTRRMPRRLQDYV